MEMVVPKRAVVRWGNAETECLTEDELLNVYFPAARDGDLILPIWETALARAEQRALFRYPQPGRPDLQRMEVALELYDDATDTNNSILNSGRITGANDASITISNSSRVDALEVLPDGNNVTTRFSGSSVTAISNMNIVNDSGEALTAANATFGDTVTIILFNDLS